MLGSHLIHRSVRYFSSTGQPRNLLEHLTNRAIIKVSGPEVTDFLQGLITNDIRHLQHGAGSMFTMILNTKGRVLFDSIIYKTEEENVLLLECDKEGKQAFQKHLKMYRVRRKIEIADLGNYKVSAVFNYIDRDVDSDPEIKQQLEGIIVPCDKLKSTEPDVTRKIYKDLKIYKDPRIASLGSRIISKIDTNVEEQLNEISSTTIVTGEPSTYKKLRYSLGVGEGIEDLPPGNCMPLECNCDYLHGVSFHKGCYIGQELTARTHHTGVVRRRLMPLIFKKKPHRLPEDNVLIHEEVRLGKLRGIHGQFGLALLNISNALKFGEIIVGDGIAQVVKPNWWPVELPKEKIVTQKM